jgi:hypothetical protein
MNLKEIERRIKSNKPFGLYSLKFGETDSVEAKSTIYFGSYENINLKHIVKTMLKYHDEDELLFSGDGNIFSVDITPDFIVKMTPSEFLLMEKYAEYCECVNERLKKYGKP